MKAIITKYIPATNTRGSRIKAFDCDKNSVVISYPHELSGEAVYKQAAVRLCEKMKWSTDLLGGGTSNGYVFVFKKQ
jgi:hypothetical protein